jgi:SnoaL-like domain
MPAGEDRTQTGEALASETLTRWYAAWNAYDVDAVRALMTDGVRYEDPSAPKAVMQGPDEVANYVRAAFAAIPDLHLDMLEEWVGPGGAVSATHFRFSGTFEHELAAPGLPPLRPTGARLGIDGMDRNELRGDRLCRHQIFWDMAEFGRQMGFFPKRGSRTEKLSRRLQHLAARGARLHR